MARPGCAGRRTSRPAVAPDEAVILLHPPVPLLGVSIGINRGVSSKMTVSSMRQWLGLPHRRCLGLHLLLAPDALHRLAVSETSILLHPPSSFSRCFNRDGEEISVKWQSRRRHRYDSLPSMSSLRLSLLRSPLFSCERPCSRTSALSLV